ncbi:phosphotransferase enzyme family protein [Histoplasma capsulatum var. duboisii H88]|uniref:Phosphotransferase enzyme family protein n=1 Tax=Ajellomyces capsulatus (strain H88) TaxID=544711 RepID=A0A8A1L8R0_AJEC8|nr:phosphotransferase enzyme family protein [Histoplasma capsulatum var. duboisii H88]
MTGITLSLEFHILPPDPNTMELLAKWRLWTIFGCMVSLRLKCMLGVQHGRTLSALSTSLWRNWTAALWAMYGLR